MDAIGPISPLTSKRHRFILTITDYFSKWAKAIPIKEVKTSDMIKFIKHHVIYRFGVPRRIVHDNGPKFVSQVLQKSATNSKFKVSSTAYYPAANGLAEAFNKTIEKLLKMFVSKRTRGEYFWAYRTTMRTPTKATPFSLINRCEAYLH